MFHLSTCVFLQNRSEHIQHDNDSTRDIIYLHNMGDDHLLGILITRNIPTFYVNVRRSSYRDGVTCGLWIY